VANKRQALTGTDLLSIVESTEAEYMEAAKQLAETSDRVLDGVFTAAMFDKLIKEKIFQASTVLVKEEPAFVLIHAMNPVGWLVIEGAVRIGKAPLGRLLEGGYALARHLKAPKIVFVTKLKGLYNYAMGHQFKSLGAILCNEVPQ
jgi:hypothetical protein